MFSDTDGIFTFTTSVFDWIKNYREQERKVGPEGFLDSNKYSHTFYVKKEREKHKAMTEKSKPTIVKMSTQIDQDKKEHEKKIKVIEVIN